MLLKCKHCGKELDYVLISKFLFDGSNADIPTDYTVCSVRTNDFHSNEDDYTAITLNADENWCGADLDIEGMINTISCPFCHEFPFDCKDDIQTEQTLHVTCFNNGLPEFEIDDVELNSPIYIIQENEIIQLYIAEIRKYAHPGDSGNLYIASETLDYFGEDEYDLWETDFNKTWFLDEDKTRKSLEKKIEEE